MTGRRRFLSVVFVLQIMLAGCSDAKPKLIPVAGTVTLDGKPLPDGDVYFKTIQTGALENFPIHNGAFSGSAAQGERRVEIIAYRMRPEVIDGAPVEVKENYLPARYNLESTLTATVAPGGSNAFAFELFSTETR